MAFNGVAIHYGCVARTKLFRYTVFGAIGCGVVDILDFEVETVLAHVGDPHAAAATGGSLVDIDLLTGGLEPDSDGRGDGGQALK
jgi:hypothetical protein